MDNIFNTIISDSVLSLLKSHYIKNLDISYYYKNKFPISIYIGKRLLLNEDCNSSSKIYNELIDDSLKEIINTDSITSVIIQLSKYVSSPYKTSYKGIHFYFEKFESINDRKIFRTTPKSSIIKIDTKDVIWGATYEDIWLRFIYHHNRLYIDPDSLQWLTI